MPGSESFRFVVLKAVTFISEGLVCTQLYHVVIEEIAGSDRFGSGELQGVMKIVSSSSDSIERSDNQTYLSLKIHSSRAHQIAFIVRLLQ